MRALVQLRYGGVEDLVLRDWPVPEVTAGMVLVKVLACGANASDWEFTTGHPAYARVGGLFKSGTRVLGSDIVGVVEAVGSGVTRFAPGDRVLADTSQLFGGFAEYAAAPEKLWVKIPETVDAEVAAALPQSGTIALRAFDGRVRAGMQVLINGAGGGSGPLALQIARAAGAEVTAVDNQYKLALLHALGADRVIDYEQVDFAAEDRTYDVILDLFGTRPSGRICRVLAKGGQYMLVGGPVRTMLDVAFVGAIRSLLSDRRCGVLMVPQGPGRLAELVDMTQRGILKPVLGEVVPLEEAASALGRMGEGRIAGKLIIKPHSQ